MGVKPMAKLREVMKQMSKRGRLPQKQCTHLDQIHQVSPNAEGCEECLAIGDTWVHLRMCMSCGKVGCCDDSKNKHASRHSRTAGHPIIRSLERDEDWMWCYPDRLLMAVE